MNQGVHLNTTSTRTARATVAATVLVLAACGGGGGSAGGSLTYTLSGTVTGLSGSGLVLRNNGSDDLTITSNGSFTFGVHVTTGAAYNVAVAAQPNNPVQNCVVTNAGRKGSVPAANITTVSVVCADVGRFAHIGNDGSGTVIGFQIDPSTGGFTEIPGGARIGGPDIAVDPDGKFLYVAPVEDFRVNATSGALTPADNTVDGFPAVFAPSGKFAYAAVAIPASPGGDYPDEVLTFTVDANSGASAREGKPVIAGVSATSIVVDPRGKFAYVTSPSACVETPSLSCHGVGPAGHLEMSGAQLSLFRLFRQLTLTTGAATVSSRLREWPLRSGLIYLKPGFRASWA